MATTTATRGKRAAETVSTASVEGKRGIDLLHDPVLNKATTWTEAERQALGLLGLVPDAMESEDIQLRRVLLQLADKTTDLDRYIYLISVLDSETADAIGTERIAYGQRVTVIAFACAPIWRTERGIALTGPRTSSTTPGEKNSSAGIWSTLGRSRSKWLGASRCVPRCSGDENALDSTPSFSSVAIVCSSNGR